MIINEELVIYATKHSTALHPVLEELHRQTYLKVLLPQMISGHLQGLFLQQLSCLCKPKFILELGTFTGFAALCLAAGLTTDGVLHTIEKNNELETFHEKYLKNNHLNKNIQVHYGLAQNIIPQLNVKWDMIFIDADKKNNALYYDLLFDQLNVNGLMLIDNVLWHGKVLNEQADAETEIIKAFNLKVSADTRVEKLLLPLRDGIFCVRKIA